MKYFLLIFLLIEPALSCGGRGGNGGNGGNGAPGGNGGNGGHGGKGGFLRRGGHGGHGGHGGAGGQGGAGGRGGEGGWLARDGRPGTPGRPGRKNKISIDLGRLAEDQNKALLFPSKFEEYDHDKNGRITVDEVAKLFDVSEIEVQDQFQNFDTNNDESISCYEFLGADLPFDELPSCDSTNIYGP